MHKLFKKRNVSTTTFTLLNKEKKLKIIVSYNVNNKQPKLPQRTTFTLLLKNLIRY